MIRSLAAWLRAAHAFPLAAVLGLTALAGVASAGDDFDARRFVLMLMGMLFAQLAIGWSNDYVDRESDAARQLWKPLPSGMINARHLRVAIVLAIIAMMVTGIALGVTPLLLLVAGCGAGLAYNFVFKDTALSFLPYIVAFAVLGPYVWTALDVWRNDLLWVYFVSWPLIIAVHVSNALPDMLTDGAAGRRNIAVTIGEWWSVWLIAGCLVAPALLSVLSELWLEYDSVLVLNASRTAFLMLAAAAVVLDLRGTRDDFVWGFRFVCLAGVVFVTGWLAAVT